MRFRKLKETVRDQRNVCYGWIKMSVIENAIAYIQKLFKENADGHGVDHTMRVYQNALNISKHYDLCDLEIISLAALLHDVDDHKLFNTINNANARYFLSRENMDNDRIELICNIINSVSFSKNKGKHPESLEGKIVQDADRLDAMGAIGIARTFAYGGKCGRDMDSSVNHFHEKLLLLKDLMNTKEAKEIAENRHRFMEQFLCELNEEII